MIRYVLMVFLILIQNSILNHIHNINTGTVAAFNIQVVMSILICRFFSLCLMVDFVIWSVFATCVGSSSIILAYVASVVL